MSCVYQVARKSARALNVPVRKYSQVCLWFFVSFPALFPHVRALQSLATFDTFSLFFWNTFAYERGLPCGYQVAHKSALVLYAPVRLYSLVRLCFFVSVPINFGRMPNYHVRSSDLVSC